MKLTLVFFIMYFHLFLYYRLYIKVLYFQNLLNCSILYFYFFVITTGYFEKSTQLITPIDIALYFDDIAIFGSISQSTK